MSKWFADSLAIGFLTVAIGGGISVLMPQNPQAIVIGAGLSASASSVILTKRRSQLSDDDLESGEKEWDQQTEEATVSRLRNPCTALGSEKAIACLESRQIAVENIRSANPDVDPIFDKHAIYLGENLAHENGTLLLTPLLKTIKYAIANNRGVYYQFRKNPTQLQIQTLTRFCYGLNKDTLLSSYRYNKDNKTISAKIQDRSDVRHFFMGQWFERFICDRICRLFDELKLPYSYLMNPIVKFTNGDRFELDLVLWVSGKLFLIECKTGGDANAHFKKFSNHCKRLSIPPSHGFLVILDREDKQSQSDSQFWKFQVTNQDNLVLRLQDVFG
ncbi:MULTISPECIES: hypothetical protein [Spirulina sp. CCY15215]|uniref:hypothetical protein n=1 Tax=Spirulina sp. CCY15215 TaxID=2767591 RepID=UPI0019529AAE|nr:hypothetical protein [Spirulina major]